MSDPDDDIIIVRDPYFNRVKRVLTSATLLVASYILIFLFQQVITWGFCLLFGYNPRITYNEISNLPFEYNYWSFLRVLIIFSAGPVICLVAGFLFLDFFSQLSGTGSLLRFFFLWLSICGINLFLGFLLSSPLGIDQYFSGLYVGFSVVGTWTRMGYVLTAPLALISAGASIFLGFSLFESLMKFSFSNRLIKTSGGQRNIILQFFVVPVFISIPVLLALTTYKSLLLHAVLLLNLLLMGMGLLINVGRTSQNVIVYKQDVLNTFPVVWMSVAAVIYLLVWFLLRDDDLLIIPRHLF